MNTGILYVLVAVVSQYVVFAALEDLFPTADKPALYQLSEVLPAQTLETVLHTEETSIKSNAGSRCGEVSSTQLNGGVIHKPFEQIIDNERCVWIISVPGTKAYDVDILILNDDTNKIGGNQELIITGVNKGSGKAFPTLTSYAPTTTGYLNVSSANILVITFLSKNPQVNEYGFVLKYEAKLGMIAGTRATHHIIETPPSEVVEFKYPPNSLTYSANEIAAIVFPPLNNIYTGQERLYVYRELKLDECYDAVYFYALNASGPEGQTNYQLLDRVCEGNATYNFRSNDVALALFQSSSDNHYDGFTMLSYSGSCA